VAWRASLASNEKNLVGLRVSWVWPQSHMDQAPDTREFRIYFHAGRQNAILGNTAAVSDASAATESVVETDIPNTRAVDAYVGARLQIGNSSFQIIGSESGSPLRLRVANIGANDEERPEANTPCSVVIPETTGTGNNKKPNPLFADYGAATNWDERYYVVGYNDYVKEELVVSTHPGGTKLGGSAATVSGTDSKLGGSPDLSDASIVGSYLRLDGDTARADKLYRIMAVDDKNDTVTLDAVPSLSGASSGWAVVRKLRRYEVFVPAKGDTQRAGSPLLATSTDPLRYGSIGVSAADDKQHTLDATKWASGSWGGTQRYGNEGRVGPAVTIYHVYRGKPPVPELITYTEDSLSATRADYHGHSFFTFRWNVSASGTQTHILRALDDTLFKTDWLLRSTRKSLSPSTEGHKTLFPPSWTAAQKQATAGQLNGITTQSSYDGLSTAARELLAWLPGNEGFVWGEGLKERDWEIRRTRMNLAASDSDYFPSDWMATGAANAQKRQDVATALNAITSTAAYGSLSNNALRVLASLPGNEAAFTQLTVQPLEYAPSTGLRAYVDTLDGRSASRYFYRALNVNSVHTRGDLSLATPPVYCPDVVPPRAPLWASFELGDGTATLRWVSNRESDLKEYQLFRAGDTDAARDVRLMQLVQTISAGTTAPAQRPPSVGWTDESLVGGTRYFYRLLAMDKDGNVSPPSDVMTIAAVDTRIPDPPVWLETTWVVLRDKDGSEEPWPANGAVGAGRSAAVRLVWTIDVAAPRFVVTRQGRGQTTWRPVAQFGDYHEIAAGTYLAYDSTANPKERYSYRIAVTSAAGVQSLDFRAVEVPRP
jgi:hypothetical protein